MRSRKLVSAHGWASVGVQRLDTGQYLIRAERPDGSMATKVMDATDSKLEALLLAKKAMKQRQLEASFDAKLREVYPSVF
jgi:hypothetical protein